MTSYDMLGLSGVAIILICYFLLQIGKLQLKQTVYSALNLLGALLIFISLLFDWNLPAAVIEIAWILISLYGIFTSLKKRSAD